VKVSALGGPVKGLQLNATATQGRALSAVTDSDGIAKFDNVPLGTQYLRADQDNGYGLQLDVKPKGPRNAIVPMRWPSVEPIQVRSVSGTMRAPDAVPGRIEQPILSLELLDGISGRIISSKSTTGRGEFDFGKPAPGFYFIHVKPSSHSFGEAEGLISVAVNPAAPNADQLDLTLSGTSCGLMYTDQRQCPHPDLKANKLAGHVSDSEHAAVGGAQIFLLDEAQNQAAYARTDPSGNFSFPGPLVGAFQLRVERGGFSPLYTPLHIEPNAGSSHLEIEVAAYGNGCSTVRAK